MVFLLGVPTNMYETAHAAAFRARPWPSNPRGARAAHYPGLRLSGLVVSPIQALMLFVSYCIATYSKKYTWPSVQGVTRARKAARYPRGHLPASTTSRVLLQAKLGFAAYPPAERGGCGHSKKNRLRPQAEPRLHWSHTPPPFSPRALQPACDGAAARGRLPITRYRSRPGLGRTPRMRGRRPGGRCPGTRPRVHLAGARGSRS